MQQRQHDKEERFVEFLKVYCHKNNLEFKDTHEDFDLGADVFINDEPYDLKVSNSRKLTVVKRYKGNWYSPLERHPDIDYLIAEEHEDKWILFKLNKLQVVKEYLGHPDLSLYTLDGNINICQNVSRLMEMIGPEMVIKKISLIKKEGK